MKALRRGEDIYKSDFTGWDGDDRQVHKVIELSFGYGGAVGAFKAMGRNYGVTLDDGTIGQLVTAWRVRNEWAVNFWHEVERAAIDAVLQPGKPFDVGRLTYVATTQGVGDTTLLCVLPDASILTYPDVRVEDDGSLTAIKAAWTPAKGEKDWPRVSLWHGLLVENATQAVCAALLREKVRELLKDGVQVVAHVHDEIVVETYESHGERMTAYLKETMEFAPRWANGLPLRADPKVMFRYGK
jgi:DNA polymerase